MAALTTNVTPKGGLRVDTLFVPAAAGGDDCATGQGVELHVKNGAASAVTVTLATPGTVDGDLAVADRAVSVPANGHTVIPVLDTYRDPTTGRCAVSYSSATSVTVCVTRAV